MRAKMDTNVKTEPLFLRISEAARLLAMSRSAAYAAIRAGQLPSVRVAGKWRIPRAALERLLEQAMRPPDEGGATTR
jgi:excisionase family DNA binding protein